MVFAEKLIISVGHVAVDWKDNFRSEEVVCYAPIPISGSARTSVEKYAVFQPTYVHDGKPGKGLALRRCWGGEGTLTSAIGVEAVGSGELWLVGGGEVEDKPLFLPTKFVCW